jgi:NADH-quinone oxidoreductase subunit L
MIVPILLAILGPLAALILILVLRRASAPMAVGGALLGAAGALAGLADVAGGGRASITFGGLPGLPLRLEQDPLTVVFSTTVATVSALVILYAVGYMRAERDQVRFYAEMSFFVSAMQTLVLAGDWVLFLASWELIGLASYLLIGFWFEQPGVPSAAIRAFLTTRGADLGLYIAVVALISQAGTSEITTSLTASQGHVVIGLLLLSAAMGKAAQVPFQGWLQDAMLGPTPVSALLHSATLVAAGAILLIRTAPLFPPLLLIGMAVVGGVTILLTGLMALAQSDLKRLLAASTSSQLGFMLLAIGAGSSVAAVVHLVAHAAMKAALFLGAGIFQHASGSTAFERMSGAGRAYPRVFGLFALAGLALAGVPPLAGFWSKDAIETAAASSIAAALLVPISLLGSVLSGAYVARMLRLLWHGSGPTRPIPGLSWMMLALAGLAGPSTVFGLLLQPMARLLDVPLPDNGTQRLLGPLATLAGLAAGWTGLAERAIAPIRAPAAAGFRPADGWITVAVRPALSLAHLTRQFDAGLDRTVARVGAAGLTLGLASRRFDESDLDGIIVALVQAVRRLGTSARQLQSGFVSRELALAAVGVGAVLLVLLLLS